jgi:tRNA threonylcarbamoyladenosine biosynthesis protein TsaB
VKKELVLAIDTTTEFGSVALGDRDGVIEEVALEAVDGYGHILFGQIDALLGRHGVQLTDITLFAAAAGPGTFTGIRVGLTAAKGFASALGTLAAGVSNLQALALLGEGPLRAAVLDARRGEVYAALYDDQARALTEETVATLERWIEGLPAGDISFVFQNIAPFAELGRGVEHRMLAGAIARLAWEQARHPAALDANYVRQSDAEMAWTEKK